MYVPQIPDEYQPMSPWAYFGYEILYAVPVVGWIFLVAHAIGARNINKRNFARSYFVIYVLAIAIFLLGGLSGSGLLPPSGGIRA